MPDREKIIAAMEWCAENPCKGCPYEQNQDTERRCSISDDTIVLLKEQETEIRQLKLALDIAKGTCKGIKVEGW